MVWEAKPSGDVLEYAYDAAGNRKSMRYPNGNLTDYTYDSLNRLTEQSTRDASNTLILQYAYTLDPTGRRTKIEELNGRVTNYRYDNLYRLTQEVVTDPVNGNYSALYSYDAVGNRTQSIIDGVTTSYSYDPNDRLLSADGQTYTYDNNGNTLTKAENGLTTTYGYDPRDRLVSVTDGRNAAIYEYNVDGIRTGKVENGETLRYLVDQNHDYAQVVTEVTNGAVGVQYLYGDDLIHQDRVGNLSYYLYDGLGSTRALSDGAGSLTDSYQYDAFGVELARAGSTANSYLFTGEQFDASLQQYYLRARYYDQQIGRFAQMDAFQGVMNDPVSLHKYLYANADPINVIDPSGRFGTLSSVDAAMVGLGVLATAAITVPEIGQSLLDGSINGPLTNKEIGLLTIMATSPLLATKLMDLIGAKSLSDTDSEQGNMVNYYRAVETPEAVDILDCDCFRFPVGVPVEPISVKRFFLEFQAASSFGRDFLKAKLGEDNFFIFKGTVSQRFDQTVLASEGGDNPGDAFLGGGRAVPLGLLGALNAEMDRHGGIQEIGEF